MFHVKPPADLIARAKFSSLCSEMHMGVLISYHSLPADKRSLGTIYADAGRRNGD